VNAACFHLLTVATALWALHKKKNASHGDAATTPSIRRRRSVSHLL